MGNPLRDRRSAAELASVGQVIEIADKISTFEHLANIVGADLAALDPGKMPAGWRDSDVLGELKFGFADADGRVPMVTGYATANVDAVCQRCLQPFQLKLDIEPKLLLLDAEQADEEYQDFEVWELDGATMRPKDIVEELLIMAMPFSAMHDNMVDCKAFSSAGPADDDGSEELVRPFAALRSQMTQDEKDRD